MRSAELSVIWQFQVEFCTQWYVAYGRLTASIDINKNAHDSDWMQECVLLHLRKCNPLKETFF